MNLDTDRQILGPIVIESKTQSDGSIQYKVWDNGMFSFHCIESSDVKAKAEAKMRELNESIRKRALR